MKVTSLFYDVEVLVPCLYKYKVVEVEWINKNGSISCFNMPVEELRTMRYVNKPSVCPYITIEIIDGMLRVICEPPQESYL